MNQPDTNPDAVKILSDDEVALIESYLKDWGGGGKYPASWNDVRALCATVRALRATYSCGAVDGGSVVGGCGKEVLTADGFRCADCLAWFHRNCINEHFKLDAYVKKLRELREQGAIDDWKKSLADKEAENTALREQLAEAQDELRVADDALENQVTLISELRAQLAQAETQERILQEQVTRLAELAETRSDIIAAKGAHVDQLQSQLAQVTQERDDLRRRQMLTREDGERFIRQYQHAAQWEGEQLMITFENEALIAALIGDVEP